MFSVIPKFHRAAPPCHISNDRAEGSISHLASMRTIHAMRGKNRFNKPAFHRATPLATYPMTEPKALCFI
ncbi:hypothetical protein [Rubritalea tangerina]|uniref:hypothetical protein n=1 Tax=Rubritalea tangerina TaxID=430798 RepID=UPI003609D4F3